MWIKIVFAAAVLGLAPLELMAATVVRQCFPQTFGARELVVSTAAIQRAIDRCSSEGGGDVVVTKGTWVTGPLMLKSGVTMRLERGSVLMAKASPTGFRGAFEDAPAKMGEALVLADNASNVGIVGHGTIVGDGSEWWGEAMVFKHELMAGDTATYERDFPGVPVSNGMPRPWLVEFYHVKGGLVQGVRLMDSPMWTLVIRSSQNVDIQGVQVLNPRHSPNTDGIDIESSNHVNVDDVRISDGDDDISIKSGLKRGVSGPCYDISIDNAVLLYGHGLSIGSETANGINHITISNVKFYGTKNGLRIKSARDRGNIIGPIVVKNVSMNDVATPILITDSYGGRSTARVGAGLPAIRQEAVTPTTPFIRQVSVTGLVATGASTAMIFSGLPEAPISQLRLTDVSISSKRGVLARYVKANFRNVRVRVSSGARVVSGPDVHFYMQE